MKKKLLIVWALCALVSIESFSQGERYYYTFNEKKFLNEVENKMIVSFQRNSAANVKTLINQEKIAWQNDSVYIINVANTQRESLKTDLFQTKGVKSVQPLYATVDGLEMGVTDEIVMRFHKDVSQQQIDELHKKFQVNVKKVTNSYQLVTVPANADALEIANQYQLSGLVKYSHPNFIAKAEKCQTVIPADPYFGNQYYLHNTGQLVNGRTSTAGADIRAPQAWGITKGSSSITIAVIDDGVSSNHPDLSGRVLSLTGSNFASGNPNDPSPVGDDYHGNACAGIIAASHDNEGIAGIAPNCIIMPVRVPLATNYTANTYADAIDFARINGADIISNSWTYYSSDPNYLPVIVDAIEDATLYGRGGKGCVVVCAAGNMASHANYYSGYLCFPSNVQVPGVLTVGASDRYDRQADYSPTSTFNYSNYYNQIIDIVAPSHRAYSSNIPLETYDVWTIDIPSSSAGNNPVKMDDGGTLPTIGSILPNSGTNHLYYTGHFGGTSAACAQVAGVAALVLSVKPSLSQKTVADIIESTARKAGNYNYARTPGLPNGTWCNEMGYGVVNAYEAVSAAWPTATGTFSPFVHTGDPAFDALFPVAVVTLHNVPPVTSSDPIAAVVHPKGSCYKPLYTATVTHYDGTAFVPRTPNNPGDFMCNNPGYPIDFSNIPGAMLGTTTVSAPLLPGEKPEDYGYKPIGMYSFDDSVLPREYILKISCPGFKSRLAKVTVPAGGGLFMEHRELIGGDANGDGYIDSTDLSVVAKAIGGNYNIPGSGYNARYDIDGNGVIQMRDRDIVYFYLGFLYEAYQDTMEWLYP